MVQGTTKQPRTYNEQADNLWYNYNSKTNSIDSDIAEKWKADMDSTLIFAGLFSATVTAFILESYKLLKQDPVHITNNLLAQYLATQTTAPNSASSSLLPTLLSAPKFAPSKADVAINILWFFSLSCNLAVALCVTFIQKSAREYSQRIKQHKKSLECARVRTYLYQGTKKWHMGTVTQHIPTLLHFSLFLFFIGLCIFMARINLHVFVVIALGFSSIFILYTLATLAPLMDRAASYETPFSSLLWGLWQRFGGRFAIHYLDKCGRTVRASVNLTEARHQCALYPRSLADSTKLDAQALRWVCEMLPIDPDPQSFVECIPGFLRSKGGCQTWADVYDESLSSSLQNHITSLLATSSTATHLDHKTRERRALVCVEALSAITQFEMVKPPKFGPQNKTINQLLAYLNNQENLPVSLGICTLSLLGRRYLNWRFRDTSPSINPIPNNVAELAQKADKALRNIDDDCRQMEKLMESGAQGLQSADQFVDELKRHLDVVQSNWDDLVKWKKLILLTKPRADLLEISTYRDLLFWHGSLPNLLYSLEFPSNQERLKIRLYPYQLLAFLRGIGVYPKLSHMEQDQSYLDGLLTWFPIQQQRSEVEQNYGPLCRELRPLCLLFNLLKPRQMQASTQTPTDPNHRFLKEPTHYSPNIRPALVKYLGPFTTVGFILDDINNGAKVTTLLEFVHRCAYFAAKKLESHEIQKLLDILFPKDLHLRQGPQALLAAILRVILDWEREAIFEQPCPFSGSNINFLTNLLMNQLSSNPSSDSKVGLETAERLLGTIIDPALATNVEQKDRAQGVKVHILAQRAVGRDTPHHPLMKLL